MKYLAIVQARCGSTRFPRKVLKDIYGKSSLERMLDRISMSMYLDEIMVATTYQKEDLPIVEQVSHLGYHVFIGSVEDVLDRYYQAAKLLKPEYVIRLTADCPLLDWRVLDEAICKMKPDTDDLAMLSETFPDGEDVEILRYDVLKEAWEKAVLASEREHVTLYVRNHKDDFNVQDFRCSWGNLFDERWTLDEPEDLKLIKRVYENFLPRIDFSVEEIYYYLQENKEVWNLNRMYARNEGLMKSLAEDKVVR